MNEMTLIDSDHSKIARSPDYNYAFNKKTGLFIRWGKTRFDDPKFSPYGPEILDLEISAGGDCLGKCAFCYKANGGDAPTHNMTLDEFKIILEKMPRVLTQIAFGIMDIHTNPDFFAMMEHTRSKGIVPNYTTHGLDLTEGDAKRTAELCGAVAVSVVKKESTYNTIKMLTDCGMDQVNIHFMLSEETIDRAFSIVDDMISDPRLKKMGSIVFLQYKPKGKNPNSFHVIPDVEAYTRLIDYCDSVGVSYGFDSCSAPIYLKSRIKSPDRQRLAQLAEPCESFGMFSAYINCHGEYFPCSFCEGEEGWEVGPNVMACSSFVRDIWKSEKLKTYRDKLSCSTAGCDCEFSKICRACPIFEVTPCLLK